jgi:hypothetical protein
MVWQLTCEAWGIKPGEEPRMRRDVVRIVHGPFRRDLADEAGLEESDKTQR